MAFNLTSWSKRGRDFGRGEPPPRGSIEYAGVGDMWLPEPPRPRPAAPQTSAPQAAPAAPRQAPVPEKTKRPSLAGPVLLAAGGAAVLGLAHLLKKRSHPVRVAVPDAFPKE
jgi:hypothetical protein